LRDFITDHLRYIFDSEEARSARELALDILEGPLRRSGATQIVDVCSGAGGALPSMMDGLARRIGKPLTATLTDLYPNVSAFRRIEAQSYGAVRGHRRSVSAFDVPAELGSFETVSAAFHHFMPEDAKRILADVAAKRRTVVVIEPFRRADLRLVAFGAFVRGIIHTPFVGPMTLARVLWTYPLPISATVFAWDGAVSCLRAYEPEEMLLLAREAVPAGYVWDAGRKAIPASPANLSITYLIGEPQRR
jgi:hypothetical protein